MPMRLFWVECGGQSGFGDALGGVVVWVIARVDGFWR